MKIELSPHERTLPALLTRQAREFGVRRLVDIGPRQWTHREAGELAARRGAALRRAGVQRADRIALMCSNRAEFLETFLGCGWIGAASVPINTAAMGPQIDYVLADSGARLLVIEACFVERLAMSDLSRTALQAIWIVGEVPADLRAVGIACEPWPAAADAVPAEGVLPEDTLAIIYTSGTTGPAKGVMCPHAQYYWWGRHTARILGVGMQDVLCTTLPLFHVNALNTFAQAAVSGARVAFEARFSASGFWPTMCRHEATVVYLLGAMVPILLAQPKGPAEQDHRVRIGLGPGVPATAAQEFLERTGVDLIEGYGSTETNFVIATGANAGANGGMPAGTTRRGVMGWLQPGFDARVVDEHDVALPDGVAGELVLRADEPFAFATGYFGRPDKTVEAWRNLWFHTGDRVVRETDGAFRFVDRLKDSIRRRGENISSWEVEQVLASHPAVAEVAVYPVRCELAEDEVMAALVLREGSALDAQALWTFCEPRLPRFAVPRYVDVVDALPRTENGKVQKYRLRERGVTATTKDRTGRGDAPATP